VAGGGDTVAALNHAGVAQDFTYISTAGGAFLEWLEGKAAARRQGSGGRDMNIAKLNDIANRMVAPGKGILAADESHGLDHQRFESIKLESTENNRRDFTARCCSVPADAMKAYISGVILFDETHCARRPPTDTLVDVIKATGAVPASSSTRARSPALARVKR